MDPFPTSTQPPVSAVLSESLSVVSLDESDLETMGRIEQVAHLYPWSERVFMDCIRSGYYLDGAMQADRLLGFAVIMPILNEWHVLNLCVDPVVHRRGVGRFLMDFVLDQAAKSDVASLWLEVRVGNTAARQLYDTLGFEQVGQRKGYYPAKQGREDALVLMRSLES
jgi:ribosomal-protein-alanine N-acetyltransferase